MYLISIMAKNKEFSMKFHHCLEKINFTLFLILIIFTISLIVFLVYDYEVIYLNNKLFSEANGGGGENVFFNYKKT